MPSDKRIKVAILDDYQGVALQLADWTVLKGKADITVFRDHLSGSGCARGAAEVIRRGMCHIGAKIAGIALVFGMNVLAWSQNLTRETAEQHGARWSEKKNYSGTQTSSPFI